MIIIINHFVCTVYETMNALQVKQFQALQMTIIQIITSSLLASLFHQKE